MKNKRNRISVKIDGVDYSRYLSFPFAFQDTGTEQLDSAIISLHNLRTDAKFRPFTPVSLCDGKYTYVIADDTVREVFGRGLYNHEITLIDETKAAERILMEAKSFTQPLIREFGEPQAAECYRVKTDLDNSWVGDFFAESIESAKANNYRTPRTVPFESAGVDDYSLPVYSLNSMLSLFGDGLDLRDWTVEVLYNESSAAFANSNELYETVMAKRTILESEYNTGFSFEARKTGIYTVRYEGKNALDVNEKLFIVPIAVYNTKDDNSIIRPYSVYDVVQILLETAEPIFSTEKPVYSIHPQEERLKNIEAPEMHFENGRSLYENLKEVGDFIHAIPKVKNGQVYFQDLGKAKRADLSKGVLYGSQSQFSAADYATTIEANFANLIHDTDPNEGSITEPYTDGFITLRSDNYRIKEEDSFIPTAFPIGWINRVIVRGAANTDIDITPAIFEKNEYDLLSGFSGVFPFSRTCALYYTTGNKNIDGLWYRVEDSAWSMANQFKRYALTNILNHFSGQDKSDYDYIDLSFQITYTPFINGRARQERTEDIGGARMVLAHNQSANKLSAQAFGENLRGKVAMLGNATESKQYLFCTLDDIPHGGEMYDRKKFINLVTTKVFPDYCVSQIDLSENYNNAGAFVQMKADIRQYEIPTGKDRCTLIEEFCVIGKKIEETADQAAQNLRMLCKDKMKRETLRAFTDHATASDISVAVIETADDKGKKIARGVSLPVYSVALGNSVYFGFSFADNFSAGSRSMDIGKSDARGTKYVEYGTPLYAKAKFLQFALYSKPKTENTNIQNTLPATNASVVDENSFISTFPGGNLIWNKDSADIGNVAYQLHFCTNDGYIVTGELSRMMPYIRTNIKSTNPYVAYFLNKEIDELTGNIPDFADEDIVAISAISVNESDLCIEINEMPERKPYKSVVIRQIAGKCIIGKNTNNADERIYFNFTRKR